MTNCNKVVMKKGCLPGACKSLCMQGVRSFCTGGVMTTVINHVLLQTQTLRLLSNPGRWQRDKAIAHSDFLALTGQDHFQELAGVRLQAIHGVLVPVHVQDTS